MKRPKIVTLSGGSGGFIVCRSLRQYPLDITAIPSVFDSGGSTGVLKDVHGALPKGDVRRCLLALLPEGDHEWRRLLEFREGEGPFADHSFGNLMLYATERLWGREGGVEVLSNLLNIDGKVIPVSTDSADLHAELDDGDVLCGESVIDKRNFDDERSINKVFLDPPACVTRSASDAILEADVVVLSPGDLFTSLLPNFLVDGVVDALNNTNAKLVYVVNLMTKASETRGFSAEEFAYQLYQYGLNRPVDYLIVNDAPVPDELVKHYAKAEKAEVVSPPKSTIYKGQKLYNNLVARNLLSKRGLKEGLVRHSSKALGCTINDIINNRV